jgi:molybdenum cofactor cytidylyltransferase
MSVAALVLAAGLSRRMAPRNKLLVRDAHGHAMVAVVVAAALKSRADPVIVVTGHEAPGVQASLRDTARDAGREPRFVHAAHYAQGMSASLQAGIAALPMAASGLLVCLGDMPLVSSDLLNLMIDAFAAADRPAIVVPLCDGVRGNPLLWDRAYAGAFAELSGDSGARQLLGRFAERVVSVETGDEAVLRDFDTPDSLGPFAGA